MTVAKAAALVLAFVGAIALGVWIGPHITNRSAMVADATMAATPAPAASVDNDQARDVQRAKAKPRRTIATTAARVSSGTLPTIVPAAAPALHERLKPLLNKGADMGIASDGFDQAEQFATVAHAARNTKVPFMVLKHRVVEEGKSLEEAIHEFNPELNATAEVQRARAEAKSDISALVG